jgi:Zn-finger nucleic acid-binding protein
MKTCPVCRENLRTITLASISVDKCPKCKGLWLEDDELRLAKDHIDTDLAWMDFEIWKHRSLPTDGVIMGIPPGPLR